MPAGIYPWDVWFSRSKLRLKKGRHFDCATYAMAQQIRNAAGRRGIGVSVSVYDNYVDAVINNPTPVESR